MPCRRAYAAARPRSRAATAATSTPSTTRADRINAAGAIRAAPSTPIRTSSARRLVEAELVARRVAERAVADAERLVGRLLDDVGAGLGETLERLVAVVGPEHHAAVEA